MRIVAAVVVAVLLSGCEPSDRASEPAPAPTATPPRQNGRPLEFKGDTPGKTTLKEVEGRDVKWKRYEATPGVVDLVQIEGGTIAGWKADRIEYSFLDGVLSEISIEFSDLLAGGMKRLLTEKWGESFGSTGGESSEISIWDQGDSHATLLKLPAWSTLTIRSEKLTEDAQRRSDAKAKGDL
jgi:hypothetical protein